MSTFTNTIDLIGDDNLVDSILQRSITDLRDNIVDRLGEGALSDCRRLSRIDLPNLTESAWTACSSCSSLVDVNMPKLETCSGRLFYRCTHLERVVLPNVTSVDEGVFNECRSLMHVDFGAITTLSDAFLGCSKLYSLVIRSRKVCSLTGLNLSETPVASGMGYIYVPSVLINSYKSTTNWSAYATQFRALEDYTVNGTIDGEFAYRYVEHFLLGVSSSNVNTLARESYYTTLTPGEGSIIGHVRILMGGVDVTSTTYDAQTGAVNIRSVTGDIKIIASIGRRVVATLTPHNGQENGELPCYEMGVKSGMMLELTYHLTDGYGIMYGGYDTSWADYGDANHSHMVNKVTTEIKVVPANGTVIFSGNRWGNDVHGELATEPDLRLRGYYLTIAVLEA